MNNIKDLEGQKNRGFSLIELLIAVALIAIMMAIAIPGMLSQRPKWAINGTTRDLTSNLMAARIKSVQQNKKYVVEFEQTASPNTFTMYLTTNFKESDKTYGLLPTLTGVREARGGAKISGCKNIVFLPTGKVVGIEAQGTLCNKVTHDSIQKFYKKVEYVGSIFAPQYIYITPFTGNINISETAPI